MRTPSPRLLGSLEKLVKGVSWIARDDQSAEDELESLAIAGLNSGDSIEADERYWAEKRQRLIDRHQKTGTR